MNNMKQIIEIEVPDGKKAIWKDNKVVFEDIKSKLPKTWKEFCKKYPITADECYINDTSEIIPSCSDKEARRASFSDANCLPSEQAAKQHLALMQLHQLRDCYRQGWKPDWKNIKETKYCINHDSIDTYRVVYVGTVPYFLAFQSKEIAEEFLSNFGDLIEQAGDLI